MQIAELLELIEQTLDPLGVRTSQGIEFEQPPLVVEQIVTRQVRTNWVPWLGSAHSLTMVVQQPADLAFTEAGLRSLWERLALVASIQAPIRKGPSIALTVVILCNDRLEPDETDILERTLLPVARQRTIPLGLFKVNLEQGVFAYAIRRGPAGLFPEPELLADKLSASFRQFARPLDTNAVL